MAVTIDATNMQLIDAADATTGWTSTIGVSTDSVNSREGGTHLAGQASEETYEMYHTITSEDYSNRTIFGWVKQGTPATEADATGAGHAMYLGDGTNNRVYAVGGVDNYGFFYSSWPSYRLNTAGLPTTFRQDGGGAPTVGSTTRVGYGGYRSVKANGTANNAFWDILRYCSNSNPALLIEGGTTGARGTFAEVVTQDESTSNAWGLWRELVGGSKAYECMFGMQFGSLDATAYFEDADFQLFINGSLSSGGTISAGSMDFSFVGWVSGTNVINFDNFFIQSIGTVSNWDVSDTNIDELIWSNGQFVDMGAFTFQAQDAGSKTLSNLTWVNCGIVNFKGIDATGITFNGASDANGAIEWDSAAVEENQDDITFISDGTGHAIYINIDTASPTTFNIDSYAFDGFAGQSGTAGNRVFYINNPSDGAITINLTNCSAANVQGGGSGFSFELAAGTTSTVTIQQTVSVTVTVQDVEGNPIQGARVFLETSPGGVDIITYDTTNASGQVTTSYAGSTPQAVVGYVRKGAWSPVYKSANINDSIGSSGLNAVITLVSDE
jgi:hypothetical protein